MPIKSPLTPVDEKRCQGKRAGIVLDAYQQPVLNRCTGIPRYVAIEAKPGKDGQQGAQSCCEVCAKRLEQEHPGFAFFVDMKKWQETNPEN